MKRLLAAVALACVSPPALAQIADPDVAALMARYVDGFNKGDAATLAVEVYANGDKAALEAKFQELRTDSFGRLEVYEYKACPVADGRMKLEMTYTRIYTFGGKMNDDEAKAFDLVKTPAGWRIASETDAPFDAQLKC